MAEIYTAPQLVRRVKYPKQRFDYASLIGDLLSGGIGAYAGLGIADKQGSTARDVANISAQAQRDSIRDQTEQLMALFREQNPADLRKAQLDALTANTESTRVGNEQNRVMMQQIVDAMKVAGQERSLTRGLEQVGSKQEEAGIAAALEQQAALEAGEAGLPAAQTAVGDMLTRRTGVLEPGPLSGPFNYFTGRTSSEMRAAMEDLTGRLNSGNMSEQQAAIDGLTSLNTALGESIESTRGPITKLLEAFGVMDPANQELRGFQAEINKTLSGPTVLRVRRGQASPEVAGMRAKLPFAAEKRAVAQRAYGTGDQMVGPPSPPPLLPTPANSADPFWDMIKTDFAPPPAPSPTTEEVHTPIRGDQGATGPMGDIGRALAMRRLEELGLVA